MKNIKFESIEHIQSYMLITELTFDLNNIPDNFYFLESMGAPIIIPHVVLEFRDDSSFYVNEDHEYLKTLSPKDNLILEVNQAYPDKVKIVKKTKVFHKVVVINDISDLLNVFSHSKYTFNINPRNKIISVFPKQL